MHLIWFASSWVIWKEKNYRLLCGTENSLVHLLENIKKKFCCESDSKLEKLKFAEAVKIGARFLEQNWHFPFVKNQSTISRRSIKIKRIFMGLILFQFMRDAFTINIDHVSE